MACTTLFDVTRCAKTKAKLAGQPESNHKSLLVEDAFWLRNVFKEAQGAPVVDACPETFAGVIEMVTCMFALFDAKGLTSMKSESGEELTVAALKSTWNDIEANFFVCVPRQLRGMCAKFEQDHDVATASALVRGVIENKNINLARCSTATPGYQSLIQEVNCLLAKDEFADSPLKAEWQQSVSAYIPLKPDGATRVASIVGVCLGGLALIVGAIWRFMAEKPVSWGPWVFIMVGAVVLGLSIWGVIEADNIAADNMATIDEQLATPALQTHTR